MYAMILAEISGLLAYLQYIYPIRISPSYLLINVVCTGLLNGFPYLHSYNLGMSINVMTFFFYGPSAIVSEI